MPQLPAYACNTVTIPRAQHGLEVRHRAHLSPSCITSNSWVVQPSSLGIFGWTPLRGLPSLPGGLNDPLWNPTCLVEIQFLFTSFQFQHSAFFLKLGPILAELPERLILRMCHSSLLCWTKQLDLLEGTKWCRATAPWHALVFSPGPGSDLSCPANRLPPALWPWRVPKSQPTALKSCSTPHLLLM